MKKIIIIILISIHSAIIYGQNINKFSIGMDANYLYHYLDRDTRNNFNYGFSLLMSEKIAKIKVSFGLNFSTLNYYYKVKPNDNSALFLIKNEYKVQYLNFPLLIFFNNNQERQKNLNPFVGVIANKAINYDRISYSLNTKPEYSKNINIHQHLGFTFRFGANVSHPISHNILLNAALFTDFKFVSNSVYSSNDFEKLPDSGITIGFNIGFAYSL